MPSKIKYIIFNYHSYILNGVLAVLIIFLVLDDQDYGGKSAKEWHLLYAEQKQQNDANQIYQTDLFNRLLKLETCHKNYDSQDFETRMNTPLSLYCSLFTKN